MYSCGTVCKRRSDSDAHHVVYNGFVFVFGVSIVTRLYGYNGSRKEAGRCVNAARASQMAGPEFFVTSADFICVVAVKSVSVDDVTPLISAPHYRYMPAFPVLR